VAAPETLVLTGKDVATLLPLETCISAVEEAFALHAAGRSLPPGVLGVPSEGGGFHVKAAGLRFERPYFVAKINANFPENPTRHGLPTIQGIVALFDAENGVPLALMDSGEITALRTAAATAVAVRHLARKDSRVAAIVGCGRQGKIQLRALMHVLPIARVRVADSDRVAAARFASAMSRELSLPIEVVADPRAACRESDVAVTCTSSREPLLFAGDMRPGSFLAAVGADHPDKQELDPRLLAGVTLVTDIREQCAAMGELHHALDAGILAMEDVHADLAEVVSGRRPGRSREEEIAIFDSTGTALQDVAAAVAVYREAARAGAGGRVRFAAS
jgi:alanine dehydrogenase